MYIKKLEIDNFKSFANKTEIPLLEGFTSITGPNGSGKSNIIDSVMFALGLRNGSALRIENAADYITAFNNRKEAFVKVTFGGVAGYDELTISRRIKKGSQGYNSTYYLNDKVETLTNIKAVLEAADSSLENVVKTVCFLKDMSDFAAFNEVYGRYFTGKPARSCVAVKELPKNVLVEIDTVAEVSK